MSDDAPASAKPGPRPSPAAPGFLGSIFQRVQSEPVYRNCAIGYAAALILLIVLLAAWRSAAGEREQLKGDLAQANQATEAEKARAKELEAEKNVKIDECRKAVSERDAMEKAKNEISDVAASQQAARIRAETALASTKTMLEAANKDRTELADKHKVAADNLDHSAKMRTQAETAREEQTKLIKSLQEQLQALQQKPKGYSAP
jgi:hypothetical protein